MQIKFTLFFYGHWVISSAIVFSSVAGRHIKNSLLPSAFGLQVGTDEGGGADSPVALGGCVLVICRDDAGSAT